MSMQFPIPRDKLNSEPYPVWKQNEPMVSVRHSICHGLDKDTTIRDQNKFKVGDTISINIYGSAPHNGGHCAFWISTDDILFTKIIDIKDCTTINNPQLILPPSLPNNCLNRCTFAFTWVPTSSGLCEIYMNCADISVSGVNGGQPSSIILNFKTNFIDTSNTGYGCQRVDDTTHWTTIFGTLKTTYDVGVVSNGDTISSSNTEMNEECYINPILAINLNNNIADDGTCGDGKNANRCDNGLCCSLNGFCGPDYNGSHYIQYGNSNTNVFNTKDDAYNAYCGYNGIGDWRVKQCSTLSNGFIIKYYFSVIFVALLIFTFF